MNTNEHELILKEEVFDVTRCAMAVLNELGRGLLEKPYKNALVVEKPADSRPRLGQFNAWGLIGVGIIPIFRLSATIDHAL